MYSILTCVINIYTRVFPSKLNSVVFKVDDISIVMTMYSNTHHTLHNLQKMLFYTYTFLDNSKMYNTHTAIKLPRVPQEPSEGKTEVLQSLENKNLIIQKNYFRFTTVIVSRTLARVNRMLTVVVYFPARWQQRVRD